MGRYALTAAAGALKVRLPAVRTIDGICSRLGLCESGRPCYEICEAGERCRNLSCSCGGRGKCGKGEICQLDVCLCGAKQGGCRPHEHCVGGRCVCKTGSCDQCNNTCKANEVCLDGKCVCSTNCRNSERSFVTTEWCTNVSAFSSVLSVAVLERRPLCGVLSMHLPSGLARSSLRTT